MSDNAARNSPPPANSPLPPGGPPNPNIPNVAANFAAVAATPYQCIDLGCLCRFMGGNGQQGSNQCTLPNGQPLQRAVRTEYRLMSEDQRQRYHNAIIQIKRNGVFDQLAAVHTTAVQTGSAHGGPAFHPWHREYLKRYELALRMVDPSISLPYWDSTLDGALPTPADSILFSQELMGQTDSDGQLRSGRFAPWRTLEGNPFITRFVGSGGACYQESQIQWVWGQRDIALMLSYSFPNAGCPYQVIWNLPELTHGNVHIFVGGDMLDPRTSANDPLFYMHHCFVDYIWEGYRLRQQNRQQRETQYPTDNLQCEPAQHFAGTPMLPFNPMNNIDGLSNSYTDNLFLYAERATCQSGANCGSPYLFCDRSHGAPRCASKVRIGGDCRGFNFQEDVCYNGVCFNGRCVGRQRADEDDENPDGEVEIQNDSDGGVIRIPDQVAFACYNEHECCAIWAFEGECENNSAYMDIMCRASCRKCTPDYELKYGCLDRHHHCEEFKNQGLCEKEKLWMTENCRKTCNRCREPRAWACTKTRGRNAQLNNNTQNFASGRQCTRKTCYNENQCCQHWSRNGLCTDSPDWMNCNCPISCGSCLPRNFTYGACSDYYKRCKSWATAGECIRSDWMKENCRLSCQTYLKEEDLESLCNVVPYATTPASLFRNKRNTFLKFEEKETFNIYSKHDDKEYEVETMFFESVLRSEKNNKK